MVELATACDAAFSLLEYDSTLAKARLNTISADLLKAFLSMQHCRRFLSYSISSASQACSFGSLSLALIPCILASEMLMDRDAVAGQE